MTSGFRLFPESASTLSDRVDLLYFALVAIAAFFTVLIFGLLVWFAIKYRRREGNLRAVPLDASLPLEVAWTAIPFALSLFLFGWGAMLYLEESRPPAGSLEIYGVAKQWMWKFHHPDGPGEIGELHVPVGRPVQVTLASEDVIHSFFVPAFRTKMDVVPGRYTRVWFEATRAGEFRLFCAEYCGTKHSAMTGRVVVLEPDAFGRWLAEESESREPTIRAGERLFSAKGCAGCHGEGSPERGPALASARFQDAAALRESILTPSARVAPGYETAMPTYRGQLTESEIFQIIAWLRSGPAPTRAAPEAAP